MKAPISECFLSIQGEGKNIGTPSIFIRFWGCNLRCRFKGEACDTPYAVVTDKDKAKMMTPAELVEEIKKFNCTHIVFTGGEPMLYQDFIMTTMKSIFSLQKLHFFYTAEIETNGAIVLNQELVEYIDLFTLSVKLKGSNQEKGYDDKRINNDAIYSYSHEKSVFKFVITNKEDLEEALEIWKTHMIDDVYLMPEGMTRDEVIKNSQEVVDLCIEYGFKFSPREHIIIWDNKRGV